ncbi:MAG: hypothetical protein H2056_03835 [Sphingopyxis sp.]|nr:hypothetical protein [Sphingopyxis sp.]
MFKKTRGRLHRSQEWPRKLRNFTRSRARPGISALALKDTKDTADFTAIVSFVAFSKALTHSEWATKDRRTTVAE